MWLLIISPREGAEGGKRAEKTESGRRQLYGALEGEEEECEEKSFCSVNVM